MPPDWVLHLNDPNEDDRTNHGGKEVKTSDHKAGPTDNISPNDSQRRDTEAHGDRLFASLISKQIRGSVLEQQTKDKQERWTGWDEKGTVPKVSEAAQSVVSHD